MIFLWHSDNYDRNHSYKRQDNKKYVRRINTYYNKHQYLMQRTVFIEMMVLLQFGTSDVVQVVDAERNGRKVQ